MLMECSGLRPRTGNSKDGGKEADRPVPRLKGERERESDWEGERVKVQAVQPCVMK